MKIFLIAITVISSLLMVAVILLQQGKGANLGSAFGSGAQGGLVGEQGRANFLTRTTSILVTIFFLSCLTLSLFLGSSRDDPVRELLQDGTAPVVEQRAGGDAGDGDGVDSDNENANNASDNAGDGDGIGYDDAAGGDSANDNANDKTGASENTNANTNENENNADDERPLARE